MKKLVWLMLVLCNTAATSVIAQTDTLSQVEYDTVIVDEPPLVVQKKVLSVQAPPKQVLGGFSLGINYFQSVYRTCDECDYYAPYAKAVDSSQQGNLGFNITLYRYRNITTRLFYDAELRYSFFTEKFSTDSVKATNYYQQLSINASLLYELITSEKNRLFVGLGLHARYLLSAKGKTLSIYETNAVMDINDFRTFNTFGGGAQISLHYMRLLRPELYLLVHPEVAYDLVSFTSYNEYYLQNRFIYSVNLGMLKKF